MLYISRVHVRYGGNLKTWSDPDFLLAKPSMSNYDTLPKAVCLELTRFTVAIPDNELRDFGELLRLSKLEPKTYENAQNDGQFGVTYEWMPNAKSHWETNFDW